MKHDRLASANAAALTVGALYIVCRVFVVLFPRLSLDVAQSWFHGLQTTTPQMMRYAPGNFVLGLVSSLVVAWIIGWCFAHCYNMFSHKSK
jgi:hypothetical protein